MEREPTNEVIRRFYIWTAIAVSGLLALLPLLVIRERLTYIVIWLGTSAITWSIILIARARLYNRISANRYHILVVMIAVVGGWETALIAIFLRK
jgi:hypothetical protein